MSSSSKPPSNKPTNSRPTKTKPECQEATSQEQERRENMGPDGYEYSDEDEQDIEDDQMGCTGRDFASPEAARFAKKHYGSYSGFMASYGFKAYEMQDCEDAAGVAE